MPIRRTYQCGECFHRMEVILEIGQADDPAPSCPVCALRAMSQEFKPVAIRGVQAQHRTNAQKLAETIAVEDYGVADFTAKGKQGDRAKVRYKDVTTPQIQGTWGASAEMMARAVQSGRELRQQSGSGLDVLQNALKSGAQPDLIEQSKKRMPRVN